MVELRLHKRDDFDLTFPLRVQPDVRAIETPEGLCFSFYFEMEGGMKFYLYLIGEERWIYEMKGHGMWLNWSTGETFSKIPNRLQSVFEFLKRDALPASDPFATKPTK